MALTVDQLARLEQLRMRILRGISTLEEETEGIALISQDRVAAATASTKARTAKAEASRPVDTKALLAGIAGKLASTVMVRSEGTPAPAAPAAPTVPPNLQGTFKL